MPTQQQLDAYQVEIVLGNYHAQCPYCGRAHYSAQPCNYQPSKTGMSMEQVCDALRQSPEYKAARGIGVS